MATSDRNGSRRVRRLATHVGARLRAGVVALVAVIAASGTLTGLAPAALGAAASTTESPLHFLEPLAPASGDPARFDGSLVDVLVVSICRVEASGCTELKTITSASSLSERLRIGTASTGSYYLANWDTSKVKMPPFSFRVTVSIDGLTLGSVDVTPGQYKSFGRTWPIKFRVDRDPAIHVRILRADGQSASQVADVLRREFGLGPDEVRALLAGDVDPFTDDEIDLAIRGVFQNAVVPSTTKTADKETRAALTAFDPATGRMTFSGATSVIGALEVGDVLVGEPSAAAPNGYLRMVTAITKPKRGPIIVETRQATFNETIREGTLDAGAELGPDDLDRVETSPGVSALEQGSRVSAAAGFGALDVGDGYNFHETIDVTIDGEASGSGVTGHGTIRIQGDVRFNAGYDIGFGVEDCFDQLPPVCVDRFEAHLGVDAASNIKVTGTFDGHMEKEYVLSTHYFKPIVFFIGPIPVVLVPIVKAIAGATGDARLEFTFETRMASRLEFGAKWTDPGDGGKGWENLSNDMTPTGTGDGDLAASMQLRAYAKADAKLLLYGVVGPGLAARIGVGADVQFPRNPLWRVFAHARGEINFAVDLGGIIKLAEHIAPLPEFTFEVAASENQAPECGARTTPIPVAIGQEVYLGPRADGSFQGYFDCNDPEGEEVRYRAAEGSTPIDLERASWDQAGTHVVTVTATDESNVSRTFNLTIDVVNTPPLLSLAAGTATVPASVQYFVTASAYDVEDDDFLPCNNLEWTATGGTVTEGLDNRTCTAVIVFDQVGTQTVKVIATDRQGRSTEKLLTVTVSPAPANPAPQIQLGSFEVVAETGPKTNCDTLTDAFCEPHYNCPTGFFCKVPDGAILYNQAVGDFRTPLTLSIAASDPNGDPLTVRWFCTAGLTSYAVTDNGDGTFSCDPYTASYSVPIMIRAEISDGVTTVRSETRTFFMLDRVG